MTVSQCVRCHENAYTIHNVCMWYKKTKEEKTTQQRMSKKKPKTQPYNDAATFAISFALMRVYRVVRTGLSSICMCSS